MNSPSEEPTPKAAKAPKRVTTVVRSLDSLVGAYPGALAAIYADAPAADPQELGEAPRGRVLALLPLEPVFLATRPLLSLLTASPFPWKGKTFDHGGNSGKNQFYGRRLVRFRAEVAPSQLDGKPALALTYDAKHLKNRWPVTAMRDELRAIAPGVAMGPVFFRDRLVAWFGLEAV